MRGPSLEPDRLEPRLDFVPGADSGRRKAARFVAIAIGFFVLDLAIGRGVGMSVAVLSVGIRDIRTSILLKENDPNRLRGEVCSLFYLAYACWCVLLSVLPFGLLIGHFDSQHPNMSEENYPFYYETVFSIMILVACVVTGIPAALIGVVLAIRRDIRVWVAPRFRLTSGWPPGSSPGWPPDLRATSNRAKYFAYLFKVTVCFVIFSGLVALLTGFVSWLEGDSFAIARILVFAILLAPSVVLARFASSRSYRDRLDRIVASTPRDCYPELRA